VLGLPRFFSSDSSFSVADFASSAAVFSESLETARFRILIHHDDDEREFAYDTGAGKALAAAEQHGWTVVSMKHDFATVFPTAQHEDATAAAIR
jgi:hypothetical protein